MSASEHGGAGAPPFQVGLLGHGTVGTAFAALLDERADEIERFNGRRPVICGVLTRSRGDFEQILAGSDLIVEVMGGLEPAREYLLRALRGGKHVVTANKQLLSQHGEELFETAREHDVRLRFEAAVAGAGPGGRGGGGGGGGGAGSCACSRNRSRRRRSSGSTGSSTARRTSSSRRWPAA